MKIVKENLDEKLRVNQHTFDEYKTSEGKIFAGEQGILGEQHVLISWETIDKLKSKYINKKS